MEATDSFPFPVVASAVVRVSQSAALHPDGVWGQGFRDTRSQGHGYDFAMSEAGDLVASGYDAFYSMWGQSPTLRRIWRQHVTGSDYPEEFAHISFLPLAELQALVEGLALSAGNVLVDLACGAGGPGLWAAKESASQLVGIDFSAMAIQRASERVGPLGMSAKATFRQGTFEATGLEPASADAVMSVDALQYVPDKAAALAEVARILRPGGRFAFVAFELDLDRVSGLWDDPVSDYRPLLEELRFGVEQYKQIRHWQEQVSAGFGAVLGEREALEAELGEAAAAAILLEAAATTELKPYCGHVLAVATLGSHSTPP